jgi:hypothetical protein
MKFNQAAFAWLGAGGIAFLSGLILLISSLKGKGAFLKMVHTSPSYLLAMTGLFIMLVSALFLVPDKGQISKE